MLDWFEGLFRGLDPLVGFLLTSSFPFVAALGLLLTYRTYSKGRRKSAVVLGVVTVVALACTVLWTMIVWS